MLRILTALLLLSFSQAGLAEGTLQVEGDWKGMVDYYVENKLEESKEVTVNLSFDGANEVIVEDFFNDTASYERVGEELFQDGNLVGTITDTNFSVNAVYVNDGNCNVAITMDVNADDRVAYTNSLTCFDPETGDQNYLDKMEGTLDRQEIEEPVIEDPVVEE